MRETENYLRRQQQVHRGIYEENQDAAAEGNDQYLQRRQLNFEEIQDIHYNSDEEEKKFVGNVPDNRQNQEEEKKIEPIRAQRLQTRNQSQGVQPNQLLGGQQIANNRQGGQAVPAEQPRQ